MLNLDGTRRCPRCGETKPAQGNFYQNACYCDGYSGHCIQCTREAAKAWCEANPDRKRENDQRRQEKLRAERAARPPPEPMDAQKATECIQQLRERMDVPAPRSKRTEPEIPVDYSGPWRRCSACGVEKPADARFFYRNRAQPSGWDYCCKVCGKVTRATWKRENPETVNVHSARWRAKHAAHDKERVRRWREQRAGWVREYNRVRGHLRRTVEREPGALTLPQWRAVLEAYDFRCAYCGEPAAHLEHLVPVSRGGRHVLGNVVPACGSCNLAKKDAPLDEFCARRGYDATSIRLKAGGGLT